MRAAQHEMLILSSRLDDACFGQRAVRHAAQVFLADPEKRMRILVETALWDPQENFRWGQNPFVQDMAANVGLGQVEIASVKKDWIAGYKFNFFVARDLVSGTRKIAMNLRPLPQFIRVTVKLGQKTP